MPRVSKKKERALPKSGAAEKYEAHHSVLEDAYGMLADLRRELSGSKSEVTERRELLEMFASCAACSLNGKVTFAPEPPFRKNCATAFGK